MYGETFYGRHTAQHQLQWRQIKFSLPVLSAHSSPVTVKPPFLNQRKGENGRRNYIMTNLHERMLPDVRIELRPSALEVDVEPTELPRPATLLYWS